MNVKTMDISIIIFAERDPSLWCHALLHLRDAHQNRGDVGRIAGVLDHGMNGAASISPPKDVERSTGSVRASGCNRWRIGAALAEVHQLGVRHWRAGSVTFSLADPGWPSLPAESPSSHDTTLLCRSGNITALMRMVSAMIKRP